MQQRILIADDSKTWLVFHKELITRLYGDMFEITTVQSAIDALDVIRRNTHDPFSVIITDLQMEMLFDPQFAGEWLIEHIQEIREYSRSKIIIISSMSNIEAIADKLNVDYIPKNLLVHNNMTLKFMFEKLMPFLGKV